MNHRMRITIASSNYFSYSPTTIKLKYVVPALNRATLKLRSGAAIITAVRTVEVLQYASFEGEFGHIVN